MTFSKHKYLYSYTPDTYLPNTSNSDPDGLEIVVLLFELVATANRKLKNYLIVGKFVMLYSEHHTLFVDYFCAIEK